MKNYSDVWIKGSSNQRTSSVLDHIGSKQHKAAMSRFCAAQTHAENEPVTTYALIARCLLTLDDADKGRIKRKFDLSYFMAKEGIAFDKFAPLADLESRHGVDLGFAYKNAPSAKLFTHFIAEAQRQEFFQVLSQSKFCSFLMDGTTDSGNIEQELVVLLLNRKDDSKEMITSRTRFFSVGAPKKADANGLIDCLSNSLSPLGIADISKRGSLITGASENPRPVIVGGGTDGASVNVGEQNGMKGILQAAHPWLMWSWCFAHRLELSCKDAFKSSLFKDVEEMLLRLYYLYEKSPKKSRELQEVVADLKEVNYQVVETCPSDHTDQGGLVTEGKHYSM